MSISDLIKRFKEPKQISFQEAMREAYRKREKDLEPLRQAQRDAKKKYEELLRSLFRNGREENYKGRDYKRS